jgi:hypothetical protein
MEELRRILPDNPTDADFDAWFGRIADRLLNGARLFAGGAPHRLAEVEVYYFGPGQGDPFAHCDPVQKHTGRWYLHKSHGSYRSGSFKGLDLSFGDAESFGGILIRSIITAEGKLIDGPSLCVDHLLRETHTATVSELDQRIGNRIAWDTSSPLRLEQSTLGPAQPIFRSSRVGLTLKRPGKGMDPIRYILRPYRYLTEPRRIRKGKLQLVLALDVQGHDAESIRQLTGCPRQAIQRYLADYKVGRRERDFTPYLHKDLGPQSLARLHGTWQELVGARSRPLSGYGRALAD